MSSEGKVVNVLKPILSEYLTDEEIANIVEVTNNNENGDLAFPTYTLAKVLRKAPQEIAKDIVEEVDASEFDNVVATGPYVNFFFKRSEVSDEILHNVLEEKEEYGSVNIGKGGNVTIDMSSPNIAKPMSMGHLRSTVIGNAIGNIYEKLNYNPIRINHLGDWGTQFGKLIVAYRKWGDPELVKKDPVNELVKLYVDFHEKAEEDPALNDEGRATFRALENGDPETVELWEWFKDESIKSFDVVYDMLGIEFDYTTGESFYNDKMDEVIQILEDKNVSVEDDGAVIVPLEEENLPPALIKKSDGATLYITRDLATAYYRKRTFDFVLSLYAVGNEQSNHFKQLKAVLKKMGNDWSDDMYHIPFGLITIDGEKMSTRKGKIVLLEDVLNKATELALEQINMKNPHLENKEEVAQDVGIGAVVFHELKTDRRNNFNFVLEDVVQFEGETGPYVQYANARAHSLLSKYGKDVDLHNIFELKDDYSWELIKLIGNYSDVIIQAANGFEPSVIAKYLITLARTFNRYYGNVRILDDDEQREARIALVKCVSIVLENGLGLLGINAPEQM